MLTETAAANGATDNADSLHVNRLRQFKPAAAAPKLSPAERSRQNGRKSKGPRTEVGKARVRYNALKHGITAKSLLLPGEDRREFEARRAALHNQIQPRNELEAELIDRLAQNFWVSRRSRRAAVAQLEYRLRHEPLAQTHAEQQQVAKLGQYLLKDVFRPVGILPCEQAGGARHPAQLVFKLEGTLNGCDWLLARFDRLKEHASIPGNWIENDGLELVRLLGKYRGELISDDLVAMVLLDSECIAEESTSRAVAYHNATGHTLAAAEATAQAEAAAAKPKAQAPASPKPKPDLIAYYPDGTLAPLPSDSLEEDDDLDDDDDDVAFSGPASDEYRRLARNFGRVKYVLDETFRLVANQPSLGPCVLRLEKLNPKNVEQARQRLTLVIDEHARRCARSGPCTARSSRPTRRVPPSGLHLARARRASASASTSSRTTELSTSRSRHSSKSAKPAPTARSMRSTRRTCCSRRSAHHSPISRNPRLRFLMLRCFQNAPKGHDKPAQGNAP